MTSNLWSDFITYVFMYIEHMFIYEIELRRCLIKKYMRRTTV